MRRFLCILAIALAAIASESVFGHEARPGYLEIRQTGALTYDVLWKVPARGDMRLAIYPRFPEDCRPASEPVTSKADDAYTERGSIVCEAGLAGRSIVIDGLAATMTDVLVRSVSPDGTAGIARVTPSAPRFAIEAAPGPLQVAGTYSALGIWHILMGIDHLLFVLALLILVRGWSRMLVTITAFTIAHSITLAAATLGFVHVPSKPVEATIALSIVFVACEIVHRRRGRSGLTETWPWVIAFSFGLLHGFGFASALREVGLPQNAIPLALLFFNVGVELGQLLFVGVVMAVITLAVRAARNFSRSDLAPQPAFAWCETISVYAIGAVAAFWLIERTLSLVA
jgi:hydrogenase/urease accessory protein HupE